jgi:hypothetical protein
MRMRYLSALVVLPVLAQQSSRGRRQGAPGNKAIFLLVFPLIALSACQTTAPVPRTVSADVSGTVVAAVQATLQAQSATQVPAPTNGNIPSTVSPLNTPVPPTPRPTATDVLGRLDAAWARSDWRQTLALLDQLEGIAPTALDFQDKRYAVHMAAGQDLLAKGNKDAALIEFIRADALDRSRGEAKVALLALTPSPTPFPFTPTPVPAPTSAPPPITGPVPIGVVLKPDEQAAAAVYGVTTPWGGPIAVGGVTVTRSSVTVPIILDGDRYLYAYDCATGRCQGFAVDIWQSLGRAQKQAYLDHVLDALQAALPNRSPTVLVGGRSKTDAVRVRVRIVGGQRTYEGL